MINHSKYVLSKIWRYETIILFYTENSAIPYLCYLKIKIDISLFFPTHTMIFNSSVQSVCTVRLCCKGEFDFIFIDLLRTYNQGI